MANRRYVPGAIYHLTWRFVKSRKAFEDEHERQHYALQLGSAFMLSDWLCVGFAMMSDEVSLLAIAGRSPLSRWTRRANASFTNWLNRRRNISGRMFQMGPRAQVIERSKLALWLAHLHNQPVRAGLVGRAAESTWTSHRAYIGLGPTPRWLGTMCGLARSGIPDAASLAHFVDELPPSPARAGIHRAPGRRPISTYAKTTIKPPPGRLLAIASDEFLQPPELIASRRKIPALVRVRSAVVQAGVSLGLTGRELAEVLKISQQAVSRLAARESPPSDRDRILAHFESSHTRLR